MTRALTRAHVVLPTVVLAALVTAVPPTAPRFALAQADVANPTEEIREAMRALPDFEGRWKGGGWMRRGPEEPRHFVTEEIVESRLDGQVLLIEGIHHSKEDPSTEVFHAFAVLSYDPAADTYRFRTHTASGQGDDFVGRVEDGAFIWGHEVPRGQIRYTIRIEGNLWEEVGEFSADGTSWNQFFEMKVERVE